MPSLTDTLTAVIRRPIATAAIAVAGIASLPGTSAADMPDMTGAWNCMLGDLIGEQVVDATHFGLALDTDGRFMLSGETAGGKSIAGAGTWQPTKGETSAVAIAFNGTITEKSSGEFPMDLVGDLISASEFGFIWEDERNTEVVFYCSR